jgi:hypothetical protein
LFLSYAFCQTTLSGYLIEKSTQKPVEFATAYINGTTIGAVSNAQGYFELKKVEFPLDLVVSHLSYESVVVHLEAAPEEVLKVQLQARAIDLASVKVVDNDLRQRNVKEFIANFIGVDYFGKEATLTNDEVLQFNRDYKKVKAPKGTISINVGGVDVSEDGYRERPINLKVNSRAPLVIDQPILGYKIRVDLESFQLNYADRLSAPSTTYWLGYYFFEPYQVEKERLQKRYEKKTEKCLLQFTAAFFEIFIPAKFRRKWLPAL